MEGLKPPAGAVKKKKIVGRGMGSGTGKTSTKGHKGQNARKGGGVRVGFEGGQTPLFRRLPKRGFKNFKFKKEFNEVNLYLLNNFKNGDKIDKEILDKKGLISSKKLNLKILGTGELTKKLDIYADKFSKQAIEKIEKAGGKAIVIEKSTDDNEKSKVGKKKSKVGKKKSKVDKKIGTDDKKASTDDKKKSTDDKKKSKDETKWKI